jgi:hypothetical protein
MPGPVLRGVNKYLVAPAVSPQTNRPVKKEYASTMGTDASRPPDTRDPQENTSPRISSVASPTVRTFFVVEETNARALMN